MASVQENLVMCLRTKFNLTRMSENIVQEATHGDIRAAYFPILVSFHQFFIFLFHPLDNGNLYKMRSLTFTTHHFFLHSFHYVKFDSEVQSSLNEREAFVDCTWSFIRGAFTRAGIPPACRKSPSTGAKIVKFN